MTRLVWQPRQIATEKKAKKNHAFIALGARREQKEEEEGGRRQASSVARYKASGISTADKMGLTRRRNAVHYVIAVFLAGSSPAAAVHARAV